MATEQQSSSEHALEGWRRRPDTDLSQETLSLSSYDDLQAALAIVHHDAHLDKTDRDRGSRDEIFRHVPWPGSQLMSDSVVFREPGGAGAD